MENELLKKLKKRQQTIEVAEQESTSPERTAAESTPPPTEPAPPPPAQLEVAKAETDVEKSPPPVSELYSSFVL